MQTRLYSLYRHELHPHPSAGGGVVGLWDWLSAPVPHTAIAAQDNVTASESGGGDTAAAPSSASKRKAKRAKTVAKSAEL